MLGAGDTVVDKTEIVFIKNHILYFPKHLKLSIAINVIVVKSEVYEVQLSMNPDSSVYYHHILSFFCFSYIIHCIFVGRIVLG